MVARCAGKMIVPAEQGDADRPTRFGEQPGRHEAVAAVVAGTA